MSVPPQEQHPPQPKVGGATTTVLVLGNQNTGKTEIFNGLTGGRSEKHELRSGAIIRRGHIVSGSIPRRIFSFFGASGRDASSPALFDTPGTAMLLPQTESEAVTRDALLELSPATLLIVIDAKNVRRSLALTLHAAELGLPMVIALNMDDEATRRGIGVDAAYLAKTFDVEVVRTVAIEGRGLDELRAALASARVPRSAASFTGLLASAVEALEALFDEVDDPSGLSPRGRALLMLGGDERATAHVEASLDAERRARARALLEEARQTLRRPLEFVITDHLYERAEALAAEAVSRAPSRRTALDVLGALAEHQVWGLVIAALVVAAMYWWVGKIGATLVVDAIHQHFFEGLITPLSRQVVDAIPSRLVRDAILDDDFGLLPTGLFLAFGIVMPVLFFFFFAFGILQSSGYLARLSVLLDRGFRRVGLNGRAVMSLVMGFSCVTMALITTRMLESKRERLVASFLILGLPCAPLLAVMLLLLAEMPLSATLAVFGVLTAQKLLAGVVISRVAPGETSDFIMVIPPLRLPRLRHVLVQTVRQTYAFMREAVPLFLLASFLLFSFDRVGGLEALERVAEPVTAGLLQLPHQAVQVFVKSIVRRESGAAELVLVQRHFTNLQLVVTMIVMATIIPCVNAAMVLIKERGVREAALTVAGVMAYSLVTGAIVSHACTALGVTFG